MHTQANEAIANRLGTNPAIISISSIIFAPFGN
jgi:hypothetical protein